MDYFSAEYSILNDAYVCRGCDASFKGRNQAEIHAALVSHRKTCREAWDAALEAVNRKEKLTWSCPLCGVTVRSHQAPVHLLELVRAHVAGHGDEVHQCSTCRSSCTGA